MNDVACKGCTKKAEGTGCNPKSFCKCEPEVNQEALSRFRSLPPRLSPSEKAIAKLGALLEQHRNGDEVLSYNNLLEIYLEGK